MKKLISSTLVSLFCVACLNAQTFDMKVAQPCYNDSIGYGWDVTNVPTAKELKKGLVRCILDCIQNTETIPQLEYLRDVTLRDAETAENKITESFYEELSDALNPNYESYHALEDMWNKLRPTVSNYQEKALDLSKQAANEWFAEELIRKGDLFNTLSFEDPIKVEKIENGIIYTDAGGRWEIDNLHPSVIEHVWEINHPQFKVDDLIKPLDSIADWRLTQQI